MAFLQSEQLLLRIFIKKKFWQKRPRLDEQGFILPYDNTPVHRRRRRHPAHETPTIFTKIGAGRLLLVPQCEGGPGWAMAATYSLNTTGVGVTTSIAKEVFTAAFQRWYECCKKCSKLKGNFVEKS